MSRRRRLSASVDEHLIAAGENEVAEGRYESFSAWVNDALVEKLERDRRLAALATFIAVHEAKQGVITSDEMRAAGRRARARTVAVHRKRG
jgi:Arc/MetJ-type ribon-helix-helix transcriptional regulator